MDNDLINISPYQMFLLHIRSPKTKSQYTQKFHHFFKFLSQQLGEKEFEIEDIEKKYLLLYEKAKNESWLFNCLLKYVYFLNRRVEAENLSGATFHNYFKNIKKFCLANDIEVKWHKLFLSAPKKRRAAIDRPPTVPEIKAILEYPDRRIKFIVLTMCSSGMRIEGWNYLRWRNIKPIERNGQIIGAKIVIYEGDVEEYYSFITAETYFSIKDWMDYRKEAGESINGNSWIARDLWNFSIRGSRVCGFATNPNKLSIKAIKSLLNRALWAQGLRTKLPEGKRRHEFQEAHGFRKFFETQCTMAGLKREIINKLMNHSNGVLDSYIKPSEDMLFNEYLKAIGDYLTINENFILQKEVSELKDKNKSNEYIITAKLLEKDAQIESIKKTYEKEIQSIRQEMNSQFTQIIKMIHHNPNLKYIKPEVLSKKNIGQI